LHSPRGRRRFYSYNSPAAPPYPNTLSTHLSLIKTVSGFYNTGSSLSVDQADGSVWIADTDHNEVVKLDTDGVELVRVNVGPEPRFVVANPTDGGAWVAIGIYGVPSAEPLKRLDADGNVIAISDIIFTGGGVRGLDIAPDGTVWVSEMFAHKIHKLSPTGELLLTVGGDPTTFRRPGWISIFPEIVKPTIPEAVQILIENVEEMNLQQGIENGLDAKLQNVQDSLEAFNADNRNDAINKLNAFINAVETQRNNKISNEQADYLIAEVQKLIEQLS
jgi:DNA-binding beta-propeller fold protein YncE